jgi:hypothetical protein
VRCGQSAVRPPHGGVAPGYGAGTRAELAPPGGRVGRRATEWRVGQPPDVVVVPGELGAAGAAGAAGALDPPAGDAGATVPCG